MIHSDGQRLTEYIVDDMTTCINLECEVDGQRLAGYLVEDGARYWVWARDESDARHLAACSLVGAEADIEHAYHKATGNSLSMFGCVLLRLKASSASHSSTKRAAGGR